MTQEELIPTLITRHEKQKEYVKAYGKRTGYKSQKEYLARNQTKRIFLLTKNKAKREGIEFTISESDIIIPETCPYLGIGITNIMGCGRVRSNASIDRIDSSKGYIPGNIQIISDLANRMKQDATPELLLAFSEGIQRIHGN